MSGEINLNILPYTYLWSSTSGVAGYSTQNLSHTQMDSLSRIEAIVTVSGNNRIGVSSAFNSDFVCDEARIYAEEGASFVRFVYGQYAGEEWNYHGIYNEHTKYATPAMTYYTDPAPFLVRFTSEWSSNPVYKAYEAFNQTNSDSTDCWISDAIPTDGSPQSIGIYVGSKIINKYRIQARNHSNRSNPRDWTLQGSMNLDADIDSDEGWVTVDTQVNQGTLAQAAWSGWYTFDNSVAYKWYRIRITDRNETNGWVSIANLQLVEAIKPSYEYKYSEIPIDIETTWSGGYYKYVFPSPTPIWLAKFFYGNSGSDLTVSGIYLSTVSGAFTVSGVTTSVAPTRSFSFDTTIAGPKLIDVFNNQFDGRIQPNFLMKLAGNYDIDRNVFLSTDYGELTPDTKDQATWVSALDNGFALPEKTPWNRGQLNNLVERGRELIIATGETSGSWISPIIDFDGKTTIPYMYVSGNIDADEPLGAKLYIRDASSDGISGPPPDTLFIVSTTETTHRSMMYDHKRVFFNSEGRAIGEVECTDTGGDYKMWRDAQVSWTDQRLRYFGSINERGTASFLVPGIIACSDTSHEQEVQDYSYWYNLCKCSMSDDSEWDIGATVSGFPYGPYHTVAYTKTFPIEGSDSFFVTSITSKYYPYTYPVVTINLGLQAQDDTMLSEPVITVEGTYLHGEHNYDIVYDHANSAWWAYLGGKIGKVYKFDLGSINKVKTFRNRLVADVNGNKTAQLGDLYEGYTDMYSFDNNTKRLFEIPNKQFSGFWAITENRIRLFYEDTTYGSKLIRKCNLSYGINATEFTDLWCGDCDDYGNLWVADLEQERVVRVNLERIMTGHSQPVDHENTVSGVVGLYAHPNNGTCYFLVTDDPFYPDQDIIKMGYYGQSDGSHTKYVCDVPGFCSKDYKKGISFSGKSFTDYIIPHSEDPIWGDSGDLGWSEHQPGGRQLNRSRYRQFKVELTRSSSTQTSPILHRFRAPVPITMRHLDREERRQIAIKINTSKIKTPGNFNMKLLTWWNDEEYQDG